MLLKRTEKSTLDYIDKEMPEEILLLIIYA